MAVNSGTSYEEEDLLVRERTLGMDTSQQNTSSSSSNGMNCGGEEKKR